MEANFAISMEEVVRSLRSCYNRQSIQLYAVFVHDFSISTPLQNCYLLKLSKKLLVTVIADVCIVNLSARGQVSLYRVLSRNKLTISMKNLPLLWSTNHIFSLISYYPCVTTYLAPFHTIQRLKLFTKQLSILSEPA